MKKTLTFIFFSFNSVSLAPTPPAEFLWLASPGEKIYRPLSSPGLVGKFTKFQYLGKSTLVGGGKGKK